ncbi:MAG TPA: hypothetical protein VGH99_05865 [Pseudonocardia sp.]|jgi:hypothetical protein
MPPTAGSPDTGDHDARSRHRPGTAAPAAGRPASGTAAPAASRTPADVRAGPAYSPLDPLADPRPGRCADERLAAGPVRLLVDLTLAASVGALRHCARHLARTPIDPRRSTRR